MNNCLCSYSYYVLLLLLLLLLLFLYILLILLLFYYYNHTAILGAIQKSTSVTCDNCTIIL